MKSHTARIVLRKIASEKNAGDNAFIFITILLTENANSCPCLDLNNYANGPRIWQSSLYMSLWITDKSSNKHIAEPMID